MNQLCHGCGWPHSTPCPGRKLCQDGYGVDGLDIPPFLKRPPETPQARGARRARYAQEQASPRFIDHSKSGKKRRPWHWPKGADCKTEEGRKIIAMIRDRDKAKDEATAERLKALKERAR